MKLRRMLLGWCLLMLLFPAKAETGWEAERFFGSLSGRTVTVTRQLWADGPLTPEQTAGPMRPETVFALRCMQAEILDRALIFEQTSAYSAAISSDAETGARLRANAWRFGLMIEDETEESLRLRYVGPVHAAAMHALQMDLEAYLLFLRQMGQIVLKRNGQPVAWVFCAAESEAVSFILPEGAAFSVSGDGAGFVVIAIGC